ncbi:hypothetical protein VTJ83DRAFT_5822 [Remersonia thermophila]|uniref:Copper homeostasis protein cutC homolog n=1 Tax=Remersonia thermophila TaxID=72144 RepID=A0ABR4D7Y0_9PEZI
MERPRLEVPIFGPDAGVAAVRNGATRLELNRAGSYAEGGTTPTLDELRTLLDALRRAGLSRPAIRIMIRPSRFQPPPPPPPSSTSWYFSTPPPPPPPSSFPSTHPPSSSDGQPPLQDFIYTPQELGAMAGEMSAFLESSLLDPAYGDGFVFGVLRHAAELVATTRRHPIEEGQLQPQPQPPSPLALDIAVNRRLTNLADPFPCVLHRAVDELLSAAASDAAADAVGRGTECQIQKVWEDVLACGFEGVLTSGGLGSAAGNLEGLKAVLGAAGSVEAAGAHGDEAKRREVEVIVGGGVRRGNIRRLVEGLGPGLDRRKGQGEERVRARVWFHSSCLGAGEELDESEAWGLAEELTRLGVVLPDQSAQRFPRRDQAGGPPGAL